MMNSQPYIIVTGTDAGSLANSVCNFMSQGYIPYGDPWSDLVSGANISGHNDIAGSTETINQTVAASGVTRQFYQAMMLKLNSEYSFLYQLYGPIY